MAATAAIRHSITARLRLGYDSLCWGVTACDGPDGEVNFRWQTTFCIGYAGRGTSGPDWNYFDDGTIGALRASCFPALCTREIVFATIQSILQNTATALGQVRLCMILQPDGQVVR